MSKSNVNPNHYKVAGRERQGEDIAQTRNKQKHAEDVARQRSGVGARSQKPSPQPDGAAPGAAPTRAAKIAVRKKQTTLLQTPPGARREHNVVPGNAAPSARPPKAQAIAALRPSGVAPQRNARLATPEGERRQRRNAESGPRSRSQP